jgi:hypothetical protein
MNLFRGAGCGSCELVEVDHPELNVATLADNQRVQSDLTPATKALWVALVKQFPKRIELIGGVGDAAHSKRKSCHNVLRDKTGRLVEGAKALDVQPIGVVGSAAFIAEGTRQVDWIWANRATNGCTVQIWQGRIRSVYKADGKWRIYTGINRHKKHHHNSVACAG